MVPMSMTETSVLFILDSTAAENDEVPDIQQFLDWKGCGAAQLLIPDAVKLPTIGVAWVHVA